MKEKVREGEGESEGEERARENYSVSFGPRRDEILMPLASNDRTMRYLAIVETVTDAAAICDYLQDRAETGDEVHAATVHPPDASTPDSDRREALNVVRVRLAVPSVETSERRGPLDDELATLLEEAAVDEIVVGSDTDVATWSVDSAAAQVVTVPADS